MLTKNPSKLEKNPSKLEKLVEFAEKGGIGTCVANQDIIAKSEADLMFYTGEVITVLKHIKNDTYLGYCEGVIGTFKGETVDFNGSLKNLRSKKSGKQSQSSSVDSAKSSPTSLSSDTNLRSLDLENKSQSIPSSPIINIIPDISENNGNSTPLQPNQNNVPIIIPTQRKSSISTEHSIPRSPHKQSTMPQLSSPEPIALQRRNNTVPIIAIQPVNSNYSNSNSNSNYYINPSSSLPSSPSLPSSSSSSSPSPPSSIPSSPLQSYIMSNDKIINSSQNQLKRSDLPLSSNNDQVTTRNRQNSTPTGPIERPNGPRSQISGMPNVSQKNEHNRSVSIPNINPVYDSRSNSPVSSSSDNNKGHSQTFDPPYSPPTSPNSSISSPPRSPDLKQSYQGYPDKVGGRNSPLSNSRMQNSPQKYPTVIDDDIPQKSVFGHYSPSTTPLPSPIIPQLKVENILVNDPHSPSTTPLPSPPRNYEDVAVQTPTTPTIVLPKITLEDSDLDDSEEEEEEEEVLISYASPRNSSVKSLPSFNSPKSAEVSTLKVEQTPSSRSDTPSEQLSANESEDLSSEDEDENKVEVKNESESGETQSNKLAKKKKDQILAIDEYGFVYDVAEEDIPAGADRIQRIIQAPGTEEKTTRTVRLYREREAKWVALLGSKAIDSNKKIKKLVRQGIPESVRGKAWQFMAGADKYRKPGVFDDLRNKPRLPVFDEIERDIHRCYPDHIQFREKSGFGQDDLHDILKAYAHFNPAVGYCQGMGRLVGMMLMQMPAEDTFWLLVATIEEYMVGYFTPTLSQVRIDSIVFEQLLTEYYPKLAQHLANNGVVPLMYMTQWFMTIFTMALPWASVLRVWDIFYFEGVKLFFRIGLAIMECTREHILKNCPTNSEILGYLLHLPPDLLTPDLLLEAAFKIRLKRSVIRRMTKRAIAMEKNNEVGSDALSVVTTSSSKETRKGLMKKSKSADKLRIDGVEFRLVGE